ncbi:MAG: HlyC/CorC family transporter [Planctomycetaceae bacterium]|nr:HlyC/CorC family transporter [Planctomycetaceae bacterium]
MSEVLRLQDRALLVAEGLELLAGALMVGAVVEALFIRAAAQPSWWETAAEVLLTAVLLLTCAIWLPWAISRSWGARVVLGGWPLIKLGAQLLAPLAAGAWLFGKLGRKLAGQPVEEDQEESLEDEIRSIVTEGHREGVLEEEARDMIESVMELRDVSVSEVMTPRTDMISMPAATEIRAAALFVVKAGHSRIPAYDKHRDDIVGIVYSKDLLAELAQDPASRKATVREITRPPVFVPETKPVAALLEEFQLSRNHMAVVLDEFGGVAGLITIEDILEEIVGEIIDEYDEDIVEGIRRIDERTAEVLARVHVDEINDQLGLELTYHGDFDTIGGLVFGELGHLPTVGEQLTLKNVRITVLDVHRRRIERVRIEILDPETAPASQPTSTS